MCELSFVGFAMPQAAMLDGYVDALRKGWSPNTGRDVSAEQLASIEHDATAFLAKLSDIDAETPLPEPNAIHRRVRWIWDGDFCGIVNLRWRPDTTALPPDVLGHIGYAIVPWKRGHGLAKRALRHILSEASDIGLAHVDVCTTPANAASRRVITANGGKLVQEFRSPAHDPAILRQRYRIELETS